MKIEVSAYSGYKGNERPLYFEIDGSKKEVLDIIDRWVEPDRDCFKVLADDKRIYTLSLDREEDIWYLEKG